MFEIRWLLCMLNGGHWWVDDVPIFERRPAGSTSGEHCLHCGRRRRRVW